MMFFLYVNVPDSSFLVLVCLWIVLHGHKAHSTPGSSMCLLYYVDSFNAQEAFVPV